MAKRKDPTSAPKQTNPNSLKNIQGVNERRTPSERRLLASQAGKASGRARAIRKTFKETLQELCTDERTTKICETLIRQAERGNLKAIDMTIEYLGEKIIPADEHDNDDVREFINAVKAQKKK